MTPQEKQSELKRYREILLATLESGTSASDGYTQVQIQFQDSGSGVYAADGINLGIKTHWKDNNTIVIETKKRVSSFTKMGEGSEF